MARCSNAQTALGKQAMHALRRAACCTCVWPVGAAEHTWSLCGAPSVPPLDSAVDCQRALLAVAYDRPAPPVSVQPARRPGGPARDRACAARQGRRARRADAGAPARSAATRPATWPSAWRRRRRAWCCPGASAARSAAGRSASATGSRPTCGSPSCRSWATTSGRTTSTPCSARATPSRPGSSMGCVGPGGGGHPRPSGPLRGGGGAPPPPPPPRGALPPRWAGRVCRPGLWMRHVAWQHGLHALCAPHHRGTRDRRLRPRQRLRWRRLPRRGRAQA